jgi:hypothetical protein
MRSDQIMLTFIVIGLPPELRIVRGLLNSMAAF